MNTKLQFERAVSAFAELSSSRFSPADAAGDGDPIDEVGGTPTWAQLIDELLRLRNLDDDWDGEGSPAPPPSLVDYGIALAQRLAASRCPPADRVIASVNGTIYFEWHSPLGYSEIEVTSPSNAELRMVRKGSDLAEIIDLSFRP